MRLLGEEIHLIPWGPGRKRLASTEHGCSRWRKCPGHLHLRWFFENVASATYYVIMSATTRRIGCNRSVFLDYMVHMDVSFLGFVLSKDVLQTPNRVNLAATTKLTCVHFSMLLLILLCSTGNSCIFLGFFICHCWGSRVSVCCSIGLWAS